MRKIMVSGFLGADAQKQISKQNREYVSFRMANREYNDPKGADGLTQTTWMRVNCFNPNLLSFASKLKKGYGVTVIGDVNLSTYQNKMGGYSIDVDIFADSIHFTGGDSNKNTNTNSGANQYSMPTTGNYGGNTSKPYSVPSAPQASMPNGTSMPTASPSAVAAPTTSSGDDDDLPF